MNTKFTFLIAFLLVTISVFSQDYVPGYYINNLQTRTEGFFKVTSFQDTELLEFKKSETEAFIKLDNKNVIEFGSLNDFKFIKRKVERATNTKGITTTKDPVYKTETVFLNVVVDGNYPLYSYNDGNDTNYFFVNPEKGEIEQLIYKRYQTSKSGAIQENNLYKIQIYSTLKCQSFTPDYINKLRYNKESLTKAFQQLNECNNSKVTVFDNKNFKKSKFVYGVYGGVHNSIFNVVFGPDKVEGDTDTQITPSVGVEVALRMPSGKLDLYGRVEYESFSGESRNTTIRIGAPFTSIYTLESNFINVLFGPRFNLGENKKMFLDANAGISIPFGGESKRNFEAGSSGTLVLTNTTTLLVSVGGGYNITKNFAAELRYAFNRNVYGEPSYLTRLSRVGLNLRYSFN